MRTPRPGMKSTDTNSNSLYNEDWMLRLKTWTGNQYFNI